MPFQIENIRPFSCRDMARLTSPPTSGIPRFRDTSSAVKFVKSTLLIHLLGVGRETEIATYDVQVLLNIAELKVCPG